MRYSIMNRSTYALRRRLLPNRRNLPSRSIDTTPNERQRLNFEQRRLESRRQAFRSAG
jgi:hypothetical protein